MQKPVFVSESRLRRGRQMQTQSFTEYAQSFHARGGQAQRFNHRFAQIYAQIDTEVYSRTKYKKQKPEFRSQ
jgi:hypothetical protein